MYLYLTDLKHPEKIIAEPAGYFMAPIGMERIGDVSTIDQLLDYCLNTKPDGLRSATSVQTLRTLVDKNFACIEETTFVNS